MLHGDRDNTVPVALGRKLRDAAPAGVQWVEIPEAATAACTKTPRRYRQALAALIAALPPSP